MIFPLSPILGMQRQALCECWIPVSYSAEDWILLRTCSLPTIETTRKPKRLPSTPWMAPVSWLSSIPPQVASKTFYVLSKSGGKKGVPLSTNATVSSLRLTTGTYIGDLVTQESSRDGQSHTSSRQHLAIPRF